MKYYFDYAATTPCIESSAKALQRYSIEDFGNPSSTHPVGKTALAALVEARAFFGQIFRAPAENVIFTSNGTEANNLALQGVLLPRLFCKEQASHLIVSTLEHPAIRNTALALKHWGLEVDFLKCAQTGFCENEVLRLIKPSTAMVSFMHVNNILGTLLPIEKWARAIKQIRSDIVIHADCAQSFSKVPHPTSESGIDLVSLSGHKIFAPKGVGALVVLNSRILKEKILLPLLHGGGQEAGFRSGTQSPALIAAFYEAAKKAWGLREYHWAHLQKLNQQLRSGLERKNLLLEHTKNNSGRIRWNSPTNAVPYIINLSCVGILSQDMTQKLEKKGCFVSAGSACSSNKQTSGDPILRAYGFAPGTQNTSIRISLSPYQSEEEIEYLVNCLAQCLEDEGPIAIPARAKISVRNFSEPHSCGPTHL